MFIFKVKLFIGLGRVKKILLGENHPDYLFTLQNLTMIYSNLGQFEKALENNLDIANIRKKEQGENHLDYLQSLSFLALNYSDLGPL